MRYAATVAVLIVAALHAGFAWLEMVAWTEPLGMKVFRLTPETAAASATLALNQGFYNLMLAVALAFGLVSRQRNVVRVVLLIIVAVGVFGGFTVSPRIWLLQALPAAAAWMLVRFSVLNDRG